MGVSLWENEMRETPLVTYAEDLKLRNQKNRSILSPLSQRLKQEKYSDSHITENTERSLKNHRCCQFQNCETTGMFGPKVGTSESVVMKGATSKKKCKDSSQIEFTDYIYH